MPQTIPGVQIARTGTFKLSTGEHTFTRQQLANAARHAQEGAAPRLGIGHTDPRWRSAADADGEPAIGRVENLRLDEDGDVLLGDYVDVPDWLAKAMPSAYPGRSLEGPCKGDDLRIDVVSLLGTTRPGIHTLEDLREFVSDEGPALVAAGADNQGNEFTVVLASTDDAQPGDQVKASANLDDLREAFTAGRQPADPDKARPDDWWWVEEIRIDPDELIVKHAQHTYRVPWTANADGTFTFGDPVEVVVQYVDRVAASGPAVVFIPPDLHGHDHKEQSLVTPKETREALGLPEDASDEQVKAKLQELAARPTAEQIEEKASELADTKIEEAVAAARAEERDKIAAAGGQIVDAEKLAQLEADAQAGREAREEQIKAADEQYLNAAVEKGKFPPARFDHYRQLLEKDRDGTREFIDSLSEGAVPVEAAGAETDDLAASFGDGPLPEGLSILTPAERAARAA